MKINDKVKLKRTSAWYNPESPSQLNDYTGVIQDIYPSRIPNLLWITVEWKSKSGFTLRNCYYENDLILMQSKSVKEFNDFV